jgi:hypothetical protein
MYYFKFHIKLYCFFVVVAIIRVFQNSAVDANQNRVLTKPSTRACIVVFCDIIQTRSLKAQEKGKPVLTRRGRYCTMMWTSHSAHFSVVKTFGSKLLRDCGI